MTADELLQACCEVTNTLEVVDNAGWNAGIRLAHLLGKLNGIPETDIHAAVAKALREYEEQQAAIPAASGNWFRAR